MEVEINESNYGDYAAKSDLLILDFWATWCGPCRALSPVIAELAKDYEGKAIVGKVNTDENPDLCDKFGIRNIPTVLFLRKGELLDKNIGATTKSVLAAKIDALL